MHQLRIAFALVVLAFAPWASAQELLKPQALTPQSKISHSVQLEFSSTEDLVTQGWQQVHAEEWQKTFENGVEARLTFGLTAVEVSLEHLDQRLEELHAIEQRTPEQESRRFQLEQQRAELTNTARELLARSNDPASGSICGGVYNFDHSFDYVGSWYYFQTTSEAEYYEFGPRAYASGTIYTNAFVQAGSQQHAAAQADDLGPYWIDTVSATTNVVGPSFSGSGSAYSSVTVTNNVAGCSDMVCLQTNFN